MNLLRNAALRPGLECRAVARADQDFSVAGKAQHHAFAAGLAVDQIAQKAAVAAGGDRDFVAQRAIPCNHMRVIDNHIATRRDVQLRDRAEARYRHLADARGLGDEKPPLCANSALPRLWVRTFNSTP